MAKKKDEFRLKRGFVMRFLHGFLRLFRKKITVVNDSDEEISNKTIYLSNHAGANGPMTYEIYFPTRLTPWGAHQMCEGVKSRWNYLYHIFYRQKLHWGKFKAFIVATLFCPISILVYRGIALIPTYTDGRFLNTLKKSCRALDAGSSILIFPEDSSEGYKNPPEKFYNGFVALCKVCKKRLGESIPVRLSYFFPKLHKIVVSKKIDVCKMIEEGLSEDAIAEKLTALMQELYYKHAELSKN